MWNHVYIFFSYVCPVSLVYTRIYVWRWFPTYHCDRLFSVLFLPLVFSVSSSCMSSYNSLLMWTSNTASCCLLFFIWPLITFLLWFFLLSLPLLLTPTKGVVANSTRQLASLWLVSWVLIASDLHLRCGIRLEQPDFVWCILSPRFLNNPLQTSHDTKSLESICRLWVRDLFGPSCWILLPPPLS